MFAAEELAFLRTQRLARLATVAADGQPTVDAVGFQFDGGQFFIGGHNLPASRKYRNIAAGSQDDAAVVVVATDPAEDGAPGWTLGHVIVHLTAGLEENAGRAATLARGAEVTGRPRYETPWEEVTTAAQVRQRLAESRRMTHAFLDAWPDAPHQDNMHEHPYFGPTNAVAYHILGITHGRGHLAQLEEIRRQAATVTS